MSRKKNCISQSTTKVKYVPIGVNYSNIVWIRKFLKGIKEEITDLVAIYCDNKSAINISKNLVMHTKTKNIYIKYHYLRELVQENEVRLNYVNTKDIITNIFTKAYLMMHMSI